MESVPEKWKKLVRTENALARPPTVRRENVESKVDESKAREASPNEEASDG